MERDKNNILTGQYNLTWRYITTLVEMQYLEEIMPCEEGAIPFTKNIYGRSRVVRVLKHHITIFWSLAGVETEVRLGLDGALTHGD